MYSIGLMSGTSMDGIDATLLDTDGERYICELGQLKQDYASQTKHLLKAAERAIKAAHGDLKQASLHYTQSLKAYLREELLLSESDVEREIIVLTSYLQNLLHTKILLSLEAVIQLSTELHAKAVIDLLEKIKIDASKIDIIGYHGQTMYHNPAQKITVQIGDGDILAKLTGITVINNFRAQDIAFGGLGAPLAPLYHQALGIRDNKLPLAVVNCGGIANISLILSEKLEDVYGFDTGPGNGLIDSFIRKRTFGQESMDKDGQYGLSGKIHEAVLEALFEKSLWLNNQNYFLTIPPKALDIRDMILIPELEALSVEDACATLEAFTAEAIVRSLSLISLTLEQLPRRWVLAGGGWYNPVITSQLKERLVNKYGDIFIIQTAQEAGWNNDTMEAQIFAYFALRSLKKLPLSVPKTTRVSKPVSGGTMYLSPTGATQAVKKLLGLSH